MLPAPRLLARLIESSGFVWPTFPAVVGARHRKFSTDEDALSLAMRSLAPDPLPP